MKKQILILFLSLFNFSISFSQFISVELSIKWEKEYDFLKKDSITNIPVLSIIYRNNSDSNFYFLKVSENRNGYPIFPIGSSNEYPKKGFNDSDFCEIIKFYDNYNKKNYNVIIGDKNFLTQDWILSPIKENEEDEQEIDIINDVLASIYNYIYQNSYNSISFKQELIKTFYSKEDTTQNRISHDFKDRFIFLKSGEVFIDNYYLIGFSLIKSCFTFYINCNKFNEFIYNYPKWDKNLSKFVYSKIQLPNEIDGYKIYSGYFNSNKISVKF